MQSTDPPPHLDLSELIASVQCMPVGISIIDRQLKAKFWNRAFIEIMDFPESLMYPGVALAEVFRFNAERGDYGPGDPEEQVRARIALALKFEPHRFTRTRKDGRIVDITGRLIYDKHGEMAGFVTIYHDITVEKRYEQELEAKNKQLQEAYEDLKQTQLQLLQSEKMASVGQLAAGLAHEINNPIGFIMSNHSVLEQDFNLLLRLIDRYEALESHLPSSQLNDLLKIKSDASLEYIKQDRPKLLREVHEGLERVKDIVAQLRSFADIRPGESTNADLRHLMDRALAVAANAFGRRIVVEKSYGEVEQLNCLESELAQVFLGMLINAGQAIEAEGTISVAIHQENRELLIEIADTGRGIAPKDLTHIFDPFFTTRDVGAGKGLGLAVAYNVIKKHGGRITATSQPGHGAHFVISLPLNRAAASRNLPG